MKRFIIAFVFTAAIFTFVNIHYVTAQYESEEKEQSEVKAPVEVHPVRNYSATGKEKEVSNGVKNKLCPVTLAKITTGDKFTYTYNGKTYRFSSSNAIEEFKKSPEKYLKEWEEKERQYKINIIYD